MTKWYSFVFGGQQYDEIFIKYGGFGLEKNLKLMCITSMWIKTVREKR